MTDAPTGAAASAKKALSKGKAAGSSEGRADSKKRFEVKKVRWHLNIHFFE